MLRISGMSLSDIDLVEIKQTFAVQVLGFGPTNWASTDKLNVSGGAIAIGHPFGMTGARITTTLLNNLQTHDKTFGIESMCRRRPGHGDGSRTSLLIHEVAKPPGEISPGRFWADCFTDD